MKKELILLMVFVSNQCFGISWSDLFDRYKASIPEKGILREQLQAYRTSSVPTIVDSRIKGIPIHETNEPCIDISAIHYARISMMDDPSKPFESPSCNSGLKNASKMREAVFRKLQEMVKTLDELAPCFGYEAGQFEIKVFEGLRDLQTQQTLFDNKMKEILASNQHLSNEEAERETAKWVSPVKNNVPVHATGAAVDLRLWDNKKNEFLDMGPFGVIWGKNEVAPTFSEKCTDVQKKNRLYLLLAAEKAGLTNYLYEFWHFSSGDRYDVYWRIKDSLKKACYGAISERLR